MSNSKDPLSHSRPAAQIQASLPLPFFPDPQNPYGGLWKNQFFPDRVVPINPGVSKIMFGEQVIGQSDPAFSRFVHPWITRSMNAATAVRPRWDREAIATVVPMAGAIKELVYSCQRVLYSRAFNDRPLRASLFDALHGYDVTHVHHPATKGWFEACQELVEGLKQKSLTDPSFPSGDWVYRQGVHPTLKTLEPHFDLVQKATGTTLFSSNRARGDRERLDVVEVHGKIVEETVSAFRRLNPQHAEGHEICALYRDAVIGLTRAVELVGPRIDQYLLIPRLDEQNAHAQKIKSDLELVGHYLRILSSPTDRLTPLFGREKDGFEALPKASRKKTAAPVRADAALPFVEDPTPPKAPLNTQTRGMKVPAVERELQAERHRRPFRGSGRGKASVPQQGTMKF